MKKVFIKLDAVDDVKDFVNIAGKYDFDIDLSSGKYKVDAKSIMGIFSLDLTNKIELTAFDKEGSDFFENIKKYIVN